MADRSMHDRGYAHFLQGLHAPARLAVTYPTRDRHSAADEAEFIAGWTEAEHDHLAVRNERGR